MYRLGFNIRHFQDLASTLLAMPDGALVIGGDFNAVASGWLDRSPPRDLRPSNSWLPDFMEAMGLVDPWRSLHPDTIQFTFHSGAHQSQSRIDYILLPPDQLMYTTAVKHFARGISDHSQIWIHLTFGQHRVGRVVPINPWYLKNPKIQIELKSTIDNYFRENKLSGLSTNPMGGI